MHIGFGQNIISLLYSQQKSNYMKAPASAEKTFLYGRNTEGISDIRNR